MDTVKIRLRKPTRVYTFSIKDISLKRDEHCIVRTERGLEWGTCVLPPETLPEGQADRFKQSVVRRVTHSDETKYIEIQKDEERALDLCKKKIAQRELPMKLVDSEYTFDRQKVIFYFTAAERVDFRQLVRDLAHDLRTRIELRHIQVRDEAKLKGGLGVCGRELCCSTWLTDFKPISMKMAKRQNLSLNPSKISGQCGRLLCCLAYENDLYQQRKRRDQDAGKEPPKPPETVAEPAESTAEPVQAGQPAEAGKPSDEAPAVVETAEVSQDTSVAAQEGPQPAADDTIPAEAPQAEKPGETVPEEAKAEGPESSKDKSAEGSKPRRRRRRRRGGRRRRGEGGGSPGGQSGGSSN